MIYDLRRMKEDVKYHWKFVEVVMRGSCLLLLVICVRIFLAEKGLQV